MHAGASALPVALLNDSSQLGVRPLGHGESRKERRYVGLRISLSCRHNTFHYFFFFFMTETYSKVLDSFGLILRGNSKHDYLLDFLTRLQ